MKMNEHRNALPMRPVEQVAAVRSRKANVYLDTISEFMDMNERTVEIDLDAVGIKAPTLRVGLTRAIEDLGLGDRVDFSIRPSVGKVYLMRTDLDE